MQKQIDNSKTGNVIYVNFRDEKEAHQTLLELLRSSDSTDMTIGYHWEKREYQKAASLAHASDKHNIVKEICNDGIMHYHRLLSHIRRKGDDGSQSRHVSIGEVYEKLSRLHRIKGNDGAAESYRRLSKAALDRATGKA